MLFLDTRAPGEGNSSNKPLNAGFYMDRYSILGSSAVAASIPPALPKDLAALSAIQPLPQLLDDHKKSLAVLGERDLHAALQLLAERAQFITAASGVMIALIDNGKVICRASAGEALRVGTALQMDEGLTGQSLRLKELLRCDDTAQDPRVNLDGCRALGIRSVMVAPLLRDDAAIGIFELLSDRPRAFEEQDASSLEWLSQCAVTALDHAGAARSALDGELITRQALESLEKKNQRLRAPETASPVAASNASAASSPSAAASAKSAAAKSCAACGFPVSPGRTLCLDCEAAQLEKESSSASFAAPAFLAAASPREQTWFDRNMYTIGTIAVAALTGLALYLKFH
jgi:putative methionine-R-sulfoxide reductase with GAF domain